MFVSRRWSPLGLATSQEVGKILYVEELHARTHFQGVLTVFFPSLCCDKFALVDWDGGWLYVLHRVCCRGFPTDPPACSAVIEAAQAHAGNQEAEGLQGRDQTKPVRQWPHQEDCWRHAGVEQPQLKRQYSPSDPVWSLLLHARLCWNHHEVQRKTHQEREDQD